MIPRRPDWRLVALWAGALGLSFITRTWTLVSDATRALAGVPQVKPPVIERDNDHIFHQYTLRVERRDELQAHLKAKGIGTAIYYPIPLHRQPCFAHLAYRSGSLPQTERAAREAISLPIYPELEPGQLEYVVDAVRGFYR